MKTFHQNFAKSFFTFFFAMVFTASLTQAQEIFAQVAESETAYYAYIKEPAKKNVKSFIIENAARPGMAMGFSSYSEHFKDNLQMVDYAYGDYSYFTIESGFGNSVRIKNIRSGKYLEVTDDKAVNGSTISQGPRRASRSQLFQLVALGNNYYALVSQLNSNLGIEISHKGNEYPLILSNRKKSALQAFKLVRN